MSTIIVQERQTRHFRRAGFFVLASLILGASLLILPVYLVLGLILALAMGIYLVTHPTMCFYLVIFTIPLTDRIRVLPISFSPNELVVLGCAMVVLGHIVFRSQSVNLRTRLDGWIVALLALYCLTGIFSENPRGILSTLKFFEAIVVYYMGVYFIRTHQLTRPRIIRAILLTALFQATLGIVQSLTGKLGADFYSPRGYLGYLGLGSNMVWHGKGTFFHFNGLGHYLTAAFLFYLPLYLYVLKHKTWGKVIGLVLLFGIITTYSRGSLLALISGGLFFLWQIQENRKKALAMVGLAVVFFILPAVIVFGNSSYVNTVSFFDRLMIWQVPLTAINSSLKSLWLGSGLNSYEVVAWPYIPANVPMSEYHNWFAHNFYLLIVLEMGLIGATIFFSFFFHLLVDSWKKFRQFPLYKKGSFDRAYNLSISMVVVSVFFASIFDHSYSEPYFQIFLFLLLGLLYVRPNTIERKPATRFE